MCVYNDAGQGRSSEPCAKVEAVVFQLTEIVLVRLRCSIRLGEGRQSFRNALDRKEQSKRVHTKLVQASSFINEIVLGWASIPNGPLQTT